MIRILLSHRIRKEDIPELRVPCYKKRETAVDPLVHAVFVKSIDEVLDHVDQHAVYFIENDYE